MLNYVTVCLPWVVPGLIIILVILALRKVAKSITLGIKSILDIFRLTIGAADALKSEERSSPRQLQNLTNTYAGMIKTDFPEFDPKEFLSSAENTLVSVLDSLERGEVACKSNLSLNLTRKLEETIKDIKSKGEQWFFNDIYIHKSCIAKYSSLSGSKIIDVEVALQYSYGIQKNNSMISGNNTVQQYKYNIEAVYVQDVTKLSDNSMQGHNCPNCGAPVNQVGEGKFCPYCGSGLKEVNVRIWSFDNYKRC